MSPIPFPKSTTSAEARAALLREIKSTRSPEGMLFACAVTCQQGLASPLMQGSLAEALGDLSYFADKSDHASGIKQLGLGRAWRTRIESNRPFEAAQQEMKQVVAVADPLVRPWLRFCGGGAFDCRRPYDETCWRNFGHASFLLPRFSYFESDEQAMLVIVTQAHEVDDVLDMAEDLIAQASSLSSESNGITQAERIGVTPIRTSCDEQDWSTLLDCAQAEMKSGRLAKVVAARRLTVELERAPHVAQIIAQLHQQAQNCTIFALRLGDRLFVGATPETLVDKCDHHIKTEALAGTLALNPARSVHELEQQLLHSQKDRNEHQFVIEAVGDALNPICSTVAASPVPQVRHLKHMMHLWTPIRAALNEPCHVLDVVARLHPTPAVGGVPRQEALDFIFAEEHLDRGWYAAPFGWCDQNGDGHFVVALRSALITGKKAHVYAGAGIVPQSNAQAEFAETELKMGSILGALGLAS